jgi:predicted branched-subunit amino acid permease
VKKLQILKKGFLDVIPLTIPVIPFGIIYGVIAIEIGLSPLVAFCMSFIIFAGSSQIAFAQLFSAGASPLAQYLNKLNCYWKILLGYLMTDQAFSVSLSYFKKNYKKKNAHFHMLGSGFTLWFLWQLSTLAGIILGNIVPEQLGLTFAIPLTFLSLIISELRKKDHLIVIAVSGLASLALYDFPFKIYIIVSAFLALGVSYILITKFKKF